MWARFALWFDAPNQLDAFCCRTPVLDGRLAQRLERSPHTREVKGSNPLSPTTPLNSPTVPGARNPATSTICAELAIYPHGQVAVAAVFTLLYSQHMTAFLRTLEFLTLGLWLGADAFLSFVVAPGGVATLGNRDAA